MAELPKAKFFRRRQTGALSTPCSAPTTVGRPARLKRPESGAQLRRIFALTWRPRRSTEQSVPYRVIIQRPKAQIAVRAGNRARNAVGGPPRRRLAEDDRLGAKKLSQPAWIRARAQANSESATAPVTMADKKPAGPPEAVVNAAAGCATRRRTRNRATAVASAAADFAPRVLGRRNAGAPRAARLDGHCSHRQRRRIDRGRRSRRPSALLMRTAAGSSRSSRAIRPLRGP